MKTVLIVGLSIALLATLAWTWQESEAADVARSDAHVARVEASLAKSDAEDLRTNVDSLRVALKDASAEKATWHDFAAGLEAQYSALAAAYNTRAFGATYQSSQTWHSRSSEVYHDNALCTTGNNIEVRNLMAGTGGFRLCEECQRLDTGLASMQTPSIAESQTPPPRLSPLTAMDKDHLLKAIDEEYLAYLSQTAGHIDSNAKYITSKERSVELNDMKYVLFMSNTEEQAQAAIARAKQLMAAATLRQTPKRR